MKKQVSPGILKGTIVATSSKSYSQRAILAAALAKGESVISNLGQNKDTDSLLSALKSLGVEIREEHNSVVVNGGLSVISPRTISVGESGLAARLMIPILSLFDVECSISGEGSILSRNMDFVKPTLQKLGVSISSTGGCLPVTIHGPIVPCDFTIDCSESSQFLSGLLFSLPLASSSSSISVLKLSSKPYVQMTLDVLRNFGVEIECDPNYNFQISGNQFFKPTNYVVEGDWSGASTILVAPGKKTIRGLNINSSQADKAIINVIEATGLNILVRGNDVTVFGRPSSPFNFDATDCPDLFPALAVLAVRVPQGLSVISGTSRLINKESNRLLSIRDQFLKMGVSMDISKDNQMIIPGGQKVVAAETDSCSDHRIAMALASLSLMADGISTINGAESVNKSYKNFWNDFNLLFSYE